MTPSCVLLACLSPIIAGYFQHVRPDFDPPGSKITWEHMPLSICRYPQISTDIPTAEPFQSLFIHSYPQLSTVIPDVLDRNFEVPSHKRIWKPTRRALHGNFNGLKHITGSASTLACCVVSQTAFYTQTHTATHGHTRQHTTTHTDLASLSKGVLCSMC